MLLVLLLLSFYVVMFISVIEQHGDPCKLHPPLCVKSIEQYRPSHWKGALEKLFVSIINFNDHGNIIRFIRVYHYSPQKTFE